MRFERRPGSDETLLALYDAVVAAEEIDLAEQARAEAAWAELVTLTGDGWDTAQSGRGDESDDFARNLDDADADRLSMAQALGVIEHLLGGRPVAGSEPPF